MVQNTDFWNLTCQKAVIVSNNSIHKNAEEIYTAFLKFTNGEIAVLSLVSLFGECLYVYDFKVAVWIFREIQTYLKNMFFVYYQLISSI